MSESSFFKAPFNHFLVQEQMPIFHQELVEKRAYLAIAQNAYQKATDLNEGLEIRVSSAKEKLMDITKKLQSCKDKVEKQKFQAQQKQYEQIISSTNEKLAPFIQRLNLLANNITILQMEIQDIEARGHQVLII